MRRPVFAHDGRDITDSQSPSGPINLTVLGREDAAADTRRGLVGRSDSMRGALMAALAAGCAPGAVAMAQQAPPPAPPSAIAGGVTTARKPAEATSIDRRTYSVAHDLQATAGSVGDVLRNLPSVEVDAANLGFAARRSAVGYTGKASLDYALTPRDMLQVSVSYSGKRLTAQGHRLPSSSVKLGYRRKLTNDLQPCSRSRTSSTSRATARCLPPALSDQFERRQLGRTAFVSLSWKFGTSGKPKDPGFEYEVP